MLIARLSYCCGSSVRCSGAPEDVVGADPSPDDVGFAGGGGAAVLEGGPPVGGPGHLENARCAPDPFDSEPGPEPSAGAEVVDEFGDGGQEGGLLVGGQPVEVGPEAGQPGEGRHTTGWACGGAAWPGRAAPRSARHRSRTLPPGRRPGPLRRRALRPATPASRTRPGWRR